MNTFYHALLEKLSAFFHKIVHRIPTSSSSLEDHDEFDSFLESFLGGVEHVEEKALRLANWTTVEIENGEASGSGVRHTFRDRKGMCGGRARLFASLAERAGLEARVFAIHSSGLRHTAAQFKVGNQWCFVDPMYGAVFRMGDRLLSFEEMRSDPEAAVSGREILNYLPSPQGDTHRIAKLKSLYSPNNIRRVRTCGFLYDEKLQTYYLNVDLARNALPIYLGVENGSSREFMRSASRLLGAPLPTAIGATNRKIGHEWTFINAMPGATYVLTLSFQKKPKEPLEIDASCEGGLLLEGAAVSLGRNTKLDTWTLVAQATQSTFSVQLVPRFKRWAHFVEIGSISLAQQDRTAAAEIANKAGDQSSSKLVREKNPPSSSALLRYLNNDCGVTNAVRDKTFARYEKRPMNWAWIFHGSAAIFAFRATKDVAYLRWIAEIFTEMLRYRDCETLRIDQYRGRYYKSWGAHVKDRKAGGTAWVNEMCTAGGMVLPAALFAAEVLAEPALCPELGETAREFVSACADVVQEFEEDVRGVPGAEQSYFVMPHDGAPEPLAHAAPFAATLVALFRATGHKPYLDLATRLHNYFRASITTEKSGAWSWPYRPVPGKMTGPGEFFFKARVTLLFPIHAFAFGLLFDDEDIQNFATTFLTAVARDDGKVYSTVSSINGKVIDERELSRFRDKKRLGSLAQIAGYYPLTYSNPEVGIRIEKFMADNKELFPRGWFSTASSVEAYAFRLGPRAAMRRS